MVLRGFFITSVVMVLTSCAWAPGQKMDATHIARDDSRESEQVELIPITPKLIAIEQSDQQAPTIDANLLNFKPDNYHIGSSDVLFITVWDHPELTVPSGAQLQGNANGRYVGADGTLFYPYVGNIVAAGKTLEDLRIEITAKLKAYIEKPQVDVSVMNYNSQSVLVSGAFKNTLPIPITSRPLTLVEALGINGVDTLQADLSSLRLIRDNKTYVLDVYALSRQPSELNHIYLKPGDSLHLPYNDNNKVYVMGEVQRPQALALKSNSTSLTDAIGSSGGLSQISAKGQEVYIIRGVNDLSTEKAKIYQLNAKSPSSFVLASKFMLQPQDVVYIGAAGITRWNRYISQLLPSLSILSAAANTANDIDNLGN